MIEALRSDEIVDKCGGRFKLTALIQHRLREIIIGGSRPLVDRNGRTDLEVVIAEIMEDKITADYTESGYEFKSAIGS
jgi:DNA-directed RNA polymerase subunit omega